MLNPKYKFKEGQLDPKFCRENFGKISDLIDSGITFTTIAMTGVGVSFLLRFLAMKYPAYFIFVDMYTLANLTKEDFYKALLKEMGQETEKENEQELLDLCRKRLEELVRKHNKIVIVFNRFDQLEKEFDKNFFANLRTLRNVDPHRIVVILTSIKPLYEIAPEAISGTNLNLVSKYIYLKPYSSEDMEKLLKIKLLTPAERKRQDTLLKLSGGHSQLYQILAKSEKGENLLLDHFVKLQMREIYESLNYRQKKQLQKIASGKVLDNIDEYLSNVGMVIKKNRGYEIFSPLLSEYIQSASPLKLPVKEAKLFRLLRHNQGVLVSKENIFNAVWEDSSEVSDWALDALIYRLRKNPGFISSGYGIESHKKLGYMLVKD